LKNHLRIGIACYTQYKKQNYDEWTAISQTIQKPDFFTLVEETTQKNYI
jgi:hypothetical protein